MKEKYFISTDKSRLDIAFIHEFLSQESYWAQGRSLETIKSSIEHSLCFGAYDAAGKQLAFARLATDYVVFAWLMDVFVASSHRGKGIGKLLLDQIVKYEPLRQVRGIGLRTEDAHTFYEGFGFDGIPKPETWMYRPHKDLQQ